MRALIPLLLALPLAASAGDLDSRLQHQLSARDGDVDCHALIGDEGAAATRDALVHIADTVQRPPWVPLRAVGCVTAMAGADPVALDAARRWVAIPGQPGLALVVIGRSADLSAPQALELAELTATHHGQDPQHTLRIAESLRQSPHAGVRAVGDKLGSEPTTP